VIRDSKQEKKMESLKVTYKILPSEMRKVYKSYFKDCPDGKLIITSFFIIYLWMFVLINLLFSAWIGLDGGRLTGVTFYLILTAAYFIFAKRIIRKWRIKDVCRKIEKDRTQNEKTVFLTPGSVEFKRSRYTVCYQWSEIQGLQKTDLLLVFKSKIRDFLCPAYAFESKEKYEDFFNTANQFYQNAASKRPEKKEIHPLRTSNVVITCSASVLIGLIILFATIESRPAASIENIDVVQDALGFWRRAFRYDSVFLFDYSVDTTDSFKLRVPEDKFKQIVNRMKNKTGKLKTVEALSYQVWADPEKYEIDFLFFYYASGGEEPDTARITFKINGEKDDIYIVSYFQNGTDWYLNGLDIIEAFDTRLMTESFSLEKDRKLFEDMEENIISNVNDSKVITNSNPDN